MTLLDWKASSPITGEWEVEETPCREGVRNCTADRIYKKDGEVTLKLAYEYIAKGLDVSDIADILQIPWCSLYRNKGIGEELLLRKEGYNSFMTLRKAVFRR